jgi:hypothetical protein
MMMVMIRRRRRRRRRNRRIRRRRSMKLMTIKGNQETPCRSVGHASKIK